MSSKKVDAIHFDYETETMTLHIFLTDGQMPREMGGDGNTYRHESVRLEDLNTCHHAKLTLVGMAAIFKDRNSSTTNKNAKLDGMLETARFLAGPDWARKSGGGGSGTIALDVQAAYNVLVAEGAKLGIGDLQRAKKAQPATWVKMMAREDIKAELAALKAGPQDIDLEAFIS